VERQGSKPRSGSRGGFCLINFSREAVFGRFCGVIAFSPPVVSLSTSCRALYFRFSPYFLERFDRSTVWGQSFRSFRISFASMVAAMDV